ncbi:MAG: glycoside hydrolase [Neptuniibacter caesariensis]|uniref:Glycoside hydrolase n=1 Tax=Neptuniibacter caesariensis TaxID=207954 RepID=A0A2G6JLG4_NEPCE|nr:MAG: glycoside hydrolase [Neptuniibacter caesariensis]
MWRHALLTVYLVIFLYGCSSTSTQDNGISNNLILQSSSPITQALLRQHQVWRGTPYRLGGNSKNGIDCSGFTQVTFTERFHTQLRRTTKDQVTQGKPVSKSMLQPGDLVFFKTGGKKVRHVGIYLEDGVFLHASTSRGVTLSRLDNPYWRQHYWTARRIPISRW